MLFDGLDRYLEEQKEIVANQPFSRQQSTGSSGSRKKFRKLGEFQSVNCKKEWPICLYDFTIKSKCPNFFVFKVLQPLSSFVINDYFN